MIKTTEQHTRYESTSWPESISDFSGPSATMGAVTSSHLLSQRHCACRNLPPSVPPGPHDSPTNISKLSETQHRGGWADVSCGSHLYKLNTLLFIEWILLNCGAGEDLRILRTARRSNQSILKENKPEYSLEDAEAEAPILWSPDAKSWLIGKDPDAGKDWGQEKGVTEDEVVGWHHWYNGHEFEQTLRDCKGQGSLACCSPCGRKQLDTTEWLNNSCLWKSWSMIDLYDREGFQGSSPPC